MKNFIISILILSGSLVSCQKTEIEDNTPMIKDTTILLEYHDTTFIDLIITNYDYFKTRDLDKLFEFYGVSVKGNTLYDKIDSVEVGYVIYDKYENDVFNYYYNGYHVDYKFNNDNKYIKIVSNNTIVYENENDVIKYNYTLKTL
jgi:hypothetical protein